MKQMKELSMIYEFERPSFTINWRIAKCLSFLIFSIILCLLNFNLSFHLKYYHWLSNFKLDFSKKIYMQLVLNKLLKKIPLGNLKIS